MTTYLAFWRKTALLLAGLLSILAAGSSALAVDSLAPGSALPVIAQGASPVPSPTALPRSDDEGDPSSAAVVVAPALHVRSGPGIAFRVIRKTYAGDTLTVLRHNASGDWLHVRLADGTLGWVKRAWTDCCRAAAERATSPVAPPQALLTEPQPSATPTPTLAPSPHSAPPATPTPSPRQNPSPTPSPMPSPTPSQSGGSGLSSNGGPAPSIAEATSKWFGLKPEAAAAFSLIPDPDDAFTLTLTPRDQGAGVGAQKRVLVLYTKPSSAYDTAISTILNVFRDKHLPAEFTVVNFQNIPELGKQALEWASAEKFDLIFSMGSDATAFVWKHFQNGPIPVVSVSSKDPVLLGQMKDYNTGSGTNIAYTSLNVPIEVQMAYLKELKPNLKTIAVCYEASNTSAIETQVKPLQQIALAYQIRIIDVVVEDTKQARTELAAKVPGAVAEMGKTDPERQNSIFWITGSTSVFNEIATINAGAGTVPVLSAVPDVVQEGDDSAVLSIGVSFESNAHLAAVYGGDILLGSARAGELKVGTISPPDIAINFKRARAIGQKIPFGFFESASFVFDYEGKLVRREGQVVYGP